MIGQLREQAQSEHGRWSRSSAETDFTHAQQSAPAGGGELALSPPKGGAGSFAPVVAMNSSSTESSAARPGPGMAVYGCVDAPILRPAERWYPRHSASGYLARERAIAPARPRHDLPAELPAWSDAVDERADAMASTRAPSSVKRYGAALAGSTRRSASSRSTSRRRRPVAMLPPTMGKPSRAA